MVDSLDMLYQAQLHHQRTTTTIVGKIEKENRRLRMESLEFQDSQIRRLLKESNKNRYNQTRLLVTDVVEDLLAQQRRLFERGFKGHGTTGTYGGRFFRGEYMGSATPCDWHKAVHSAAWSRG